MFAPFLLGLLYGRADLVGELPRRRREGKDRGNLTKNRFFLKKQSTVKDVKVTFAACFTGLPQFGSCLQTSSQDQFLPSA